MLHQADAFVAAPALRPTVAPSSGERRGRALPHPQPRAAPRHARWTAVTDLSRAPVPPSPPSRAHNKELLHHHQQQQQQPDGARARHAQDSENAASASGGSSSSAAAAASLAATPTRALRDVLAEDRARVDAALADALDSAARDPRAARIVDAMRHSLMAGGKRVRPILVLASYDMFASPEMRQPAMRDRAALPTALAVEMIHTMSLIHDDLPSMDNDDFRRGLPTCHKIYGEDTAILAGDALLAYAYEVVARDTRDVDPHRVLRTIAMLGESVGASGLAGGQVMDLSAEGRDDVTLDELNAIHTHKTATLLRVSVTAGALLAGADENDLARVEEFAVKTGLAFQIADDVLDVTQTTEALGKTAGKDAAVNKATYPRLLGLEGSRRRAQTLIADAKRCLEPYGARADTLLALADFIINRSN
jgi:geranylgeranyl diphosphate synthase, type II